MLKVIFNIILTIICFTLQNNSYAQVSVGEKDNVEVNSALTSQCQDHFIHHDIQGEATLEFNAFYHQNLSTKDHIKLPKLLIREASFLINNPLTIIGDLEIIKAEVRLLSPLLLRGKLKTSENSWIVGQDLIHALSNLSTTDQPISQNRDGFQMPYISNDINSDVQDLFNFKTNSSISSAISSSYTEIDHTVNLPPPENPPTRLRPGILV